MYLISVLVAFFLGGLFAMLIRMQLLDPSGLLFHKLTPSGQPDVFQTYNQIFTVHGAVMIFLVLIPGIPGALGNFVLPIMLGAKDVAFPRLNLGQLLLLRRRHGLRPGLAGGRRGRHRLDVLHALQRADVDAPSSASSSGPSCWGSARSSPA